jgi:hypothetical protein
MKLDRNLERKLATLPEVRGEIRAEVKDGAAEAKSNLAAHKDRGDSQIKTAFGPVDGYIVLDDTRGLLAAMSIEKGTSRTRATNVLGDVYGQDALGR